MALRIHERDTMATIAIRIRSLAQLFDALDPAPLQERALERNAESYILACAGKHRPTEPLRLLVHLPESLRGLAARRDRCRSRTLSPGACAGRAELSPPPADWRLHTRARPEHWESHLDHAMLKRLASIPVAFLFQPDADRQA